MEDARPLHQVDEVEDQPRRDQRGGQAVQSSAAAHQGNDRHGFGAAIAGDREPTQNVRSHRREFISRCRVEYDSGDGLLDAHARRFRCQAVRPASPLLPQLEKEGLGAVSASRLHRIVLESLRNCDGKRVRKRDVRTLAAWKPRRNPEIRSSSPGSSFRISRSPIARRPGRHALGRGPPPARSQAHQPLVPVARSSTTPCRSRWNTPTRCG